MYHGSRNQSLEFFPAICFTDCPTSAAAYGDYTHEVTIDESKLRIKKIEMTDEELRSAIDDNEWPCDRKADITATIDAGYDAVAYLDVDQFGREHNCLRILTQAAWDAAVIVA